MDRMLPIYHMYYRQDRLLMFELVLVLFLEARQDFHLMVDLGHKDLGGQKDTDPLHL